MLNAVKQLMRTDQFQKFWVEANRKAHELAVKILRNETKVVSTANGEVTLNFLPLIGQALLARDREGGPASAAPARTCPTSPPRPRPTRPEPSSARPSVARCPDDFGVVTVFKSDQLKAAQDGVGLFDKLVVGAADPHPAADRGARSCWPRTGAARSSRLALGTVVALVIANAVINALKDQIVGLVGGAEARAAAKVTVQQLVSRLDLITRSLVVLGLVVALVAFLTGGSRLAQRIRGESARVGRALVGTSHRRERAARRALDARPRRRAALGARLARGACCCCSSWSAAGSGLFLTLVVLGLFEAGVSYVGTRQWPDAPPTAT